MIKLFRYLKNYRAQSILGPLGKLLEAIFELIVPLVMAKIIDVGIKNGDTVYIYKMGGVLVLLGILGLAASLTAQFFAAKAAVGFGTELRGDLFKHINTLSHSEIDKIGSSTLVTRMTVDTNAAQSGVNMLLRLFLRAPFIVIGAVIMALSISVKLTLIFVAIIPLLSVVIYYVVKRTVPMYKNIQKKLDKITLITGENISGVRVIRAFSRQADEERQFHSSADELLDVQIGAGRVSAIMSPLTYVIMNIAVLLIIWCGGFSVNSGSVTQGEIIALVNYMTQIMIALIRMAELIQSLTKAQASSSRILEIFDRKSTLTDDGNTELKENPDSPAVEFKNVNFSYVNSERNSLEGISFSVARGETVGIIGGTGCGKSTLVNLIPRFYDVSGGEVLVGGFDVKKYPFEQLRKKVGVVPQKAVLFKGTVRENMQWRDKNADDTQIKNALKTAQALDFVMDKPEGLDHTLTQGGANLSGGQRQRLTIARALVGNPEILILDDSASALDLATDAALRKALAEVGKSGDMTVFIVSQRIASVRNADKIIVLDDGKVAGIGTHAELLDGCNIYKEICLSQLTAEEV